MNYIVFYSWQSDLPSATNRGLIGKALEIAVKAIAADDSITVDPAIDRDTKGEAGTPEIPATILSKIESDQAFVADVSIISQGRQCRQTPNPNVMFELGYAIKHLGWSRVLLTMNTHFGGIDQLPFDLDKRRVIPYVARPEDADRSTPRNDLAKTLESAIRAMIEEEEKVALAKTASSALHMAIEAIESASPATSARISNYWEWLIGSLASKEPDWRAERPMEDLLVEGLATTVDEVAAFSRVARAASQAPASTAVLALGKGFERVLERYDMVTGQGTASYVNQFNYWQFIGHELYVSLVGLLLQEQRWETLAELLRQKYIQQYWTQSRTTGVATYCDLSEHLELLERWKAKQRDKWYSPQGQILIERHSGEPLNRLVDRDALCDADFFLYLKSLTDGKKAGDHRLWFPPTTVYIRNTPRFILEASHGATAVKVKDLLGLVGIPKLKEVLVAAIGELNCSRVHGHDKVRIRPSDIEAIGRE